MLFWIHGGGWTGGDRLSGTGQSHIAWFVEHGYMVVSADYTLSSDTQHLWDYTDSELACALAWTGEHAAEYGGDASRLATAGESAGAQLAMLLAYKSSEGSLASSCGGEVPQVRAVSALYPAADLEAIHANSHPVFGSVINEAVTSYTGGGPSEQPSAYLEASPLTHASSDADHTGHERPHGPRSRQRRAR